MLDNKQSAMTHDRVVLLNELDFAWNAQEVAWDRHLNNFKSFRAELGHCNVPVNHAKYPQLHLWVREQRRHYALMQQGKNSHMTEARVQELNRIGFCWDTCEAQWTERLQELTEFQLKHGHCVIPANYTECPKLGSWVSNQRRVYKNSKHGKPGYMPKERVLALEAIGFTWCPRDK
jgi:Helicase associated domain